MAVKEGMTLKEAWDLASLTSAREPIVVLRKDPEDKRRLYFENGKLMETVNIGFPFNMGEDGWFVFIQPTFIRISAERVGERGICWWFTPEEVL